MNVVMVLQTGGDFTFYDVELLAIHLKKQWNGAEPLNIYCLHNRIQEPYELTDITLLPMTYSYYTGWWAKINLFSPHLEHLQPFLYIDLDSAVVNYINEEIVPQSALNKFITLSDFYHPGKLASGLMWVPKGNEKISTVWDRWLTNPAGWMKQYRGDQDFLRTVVLADVFWQDITNQIVSFKPQDGRHIHWLTELAKETSIVCFHGKPRIHEAALSVDWVHRYLKKQRQEEYAV